MTTTSKSSVANALENSYDAYYNSTTNNGNSKSLVKKKVLPKVKKANCPSCGTIASHNIIEYKNKDSRLECVFCSYKFNALGNCVITRS